MYKLLQLFDKVNDHQETKIELVILLINMNFEWHLASSFAILSSLQQGQAEYSWHLWQ